MLDIGQSWICDYLAQIISNMSNPWWSYKVLLVLCYFTCVRFLIVCLCLIALNYILTKLSDCVVSCHMNFKTLFCPPNRSVMVSPFFRTALPTKYGHFWVKLLSKENPRSIGAEKGLCLCVCVLRDRLVTCPG